jgi:hypothetical protein
MTFKGQHGGGTGHTKFPDLDRTPAMTDKHPPKCIFGFSEKSLIIKLPNKNVFLFPARVTFMCHLIHTALTVAQLPLCTKVNNEYAPEDPSPLGYDPVPNGSYRLSEKLQNAGNYLPNDTASYCRRRESSPTPLQKNFKSRKVQSRVYCRVCHDKADGHKTMTKKTNKSESYFCCVFSSALR